MRITTVERWRRGGVEGNAEVLHRFTAPRLHMFLGVVSVLMWSTVASAAAGDAALKQGNRQFKKGNYEQALKLYDDALIDQPYSPILHFNAGAAAHQKGDFDRADREFQESAKSADPGLRSASHYNRGNTFFRQGKIDEAIASYQDALRANPEDNDAKYNLGIALQAKQNPPKQNQASVDQKNVKAKLEEKKAEQRRPSMSREDAERLLKAAAANEKKRQPPQGQGPGPADDEDW